MVPGNCSAEKGKHDRKREELGPRFHDPQQQIFHNIPLSHVWFLTTKSIDSAALTRLRQHRLIVCERTIPE